MAVTFRLWLKYHCNRGTYSKCFIALMTPKNLSSSWNRLSPSSFLVLFHVPGDRFFPNGSHDEQGEEFANDLGQSASRNLKGL